jgi:hypothetical protein
MELLKIRGNWKNPSISFNPNGKLQIWGRSLPENALDTYKPIFTWLENYKKNPAVKTEIDFKLEYFNTTSSKLIYEIFKKFEDLKADGNNLHVKWHYESDDSDMEEEGKLLSNIIKVEIELIAVEEFDFSY